VYQPAVVAYSCGCGGAVYSAPAEKVPAAPAPPPAKTEAGSLDNGANAARITVKLPSNARLWVDNVYCPLTSNERSFNTPVLQPGQRYFYTMRMEVEKDGRTESENRRIYVAAGRQVSVDFNAPAAVTAQR